MVPDIPAALRIAAREGLQMKVCIARKQPFDLAGGTHTIDLEQNYDDGPAAAQCGAKLF